MPILDRSIASAPARLLDEIEEKRMELSNDQLIAEATEINHAGVNDRTVRRYGDHLVHFGQYLASAQGVDFCGCRSKHVRLFMAHLERQGGADPHPSRLACEWCRIRGYRRGGSPAGFRPRAGRSDRSRVRAHDGVVKARASVHLVSCGFPRPGRPRR
jgi:hypothetical protein